ncbi:MAG: metallophosphoesterase, partial [Bacteroidota bacterium]|nr:metallophosphoesterase [Bacteroidota bacterium]
MRRFVFSDSHGGYKGMVQCLDRCGFNKTEDQLYFLGDVVDGWSETKESIELLLSIPNLIHLLGNHDEWAIKYYTGELLEPDAEDQLEMEAWITQGGAATVKSYGFKTDMPKNHLQFLLNAKPYHVTIDNILMIHAGFDPETPIRHTNTEYLVWSRNFISKHYQSFRKSKKNFLLKSPPVISNHKEIYLGHTPTISFDEDETKPLQMGNVY